MPQFDLGLRRLKLPFCARACVCALLVLKQGSQCAPGQKQRHKSAHPAISRRVRLLKAPSPVGKEAMLGHALMCRSLRLQRALRLSGRLQMGLLCTAMLKEPSAVSSLASHIAEIWGLIAPAQAKAFQGREAAKVVR